jgi:hypothetical protein
MKQGEIELLQRRIAALQEEGFDLEAWKSATMVLLDRIFGPGNQKAAHIEKIRYEQSSWALRDAKGSKNLIESCKKQGEEILKVAIEELQLVGLPADDEDGMQDVLARVVTHALENELKVAQLREVVAVLKSDRKPEDLGKAVLEKLREFGHETVPGILTAILTAPETRERL